MIAGGGVARAVGAAFVAGGPFAAGAWAMCTSAADDETAAELSY